MNVQAQKAIIIEKFKQVNDVNLINAVKNMLDFALAKSEDNIVVSEQQKRIVKQRLKKMNEHPESCMSWEQIENKIKL